MTPQDRLNDFIKAIGSALREAVGSQDAATPTASMVRTILAMLPDNPAIERPQSHTLHAACRAMDQTFGHFDIEKMPEWPALKHLGSTIKALEPFCAWQQNPNYTITNQSEEFVNGQAYQAQLGPEGLADAGNLAVFSMLMAPGVDYKEHAHPAEELYFIVSGSAAWKSGDSDWRTLGAGSLIHHPCGIVHTTRTTTSPLLCLAFWTGNLEQRAKVI